MRILGLEITKAAPLRPVDNRGGHWTPWSGGTIHEPFSGAWQKNLEWTADTVLRHPTVYACATLISNDIAKLRWKLMEQGTDRIWREVNNPAYSPVLKRPNRYQNHIQFKQWWIMSKLITGNTVILKERDNRNVVTAEYVLDWRYVTPLVSPDGSIFYQLNSDNLNGVPEEGVTVPASEIIHDRMNCLFHPLVGVSPLYAAGASANMGLKIEDNSTTFFGNNSNPGGVLVAPGAISDETAVRLKAHWDANYTGKNAGRVAVLGDGLKYEPMRQSAADSQMKEVLSWTDERICAAFHVPPYKVGVGGVPSYNNVEALALQYYQDCLQILIEEMESCQDDGLALGTVNGRALGVELDLNGLLRMDMASQVTTLAAAVGGTIMKPNEARERLNLEPVAGGDTVYSQVQNYSLEALNERDKTNPLAVPAEAPAAVAAPTTPAEPEADAQEQMRAFLEHIQKGLADA